MCSVLRRGACSCVGSAPTKPHVAETSRLRNSYQFCQRLGSMKLGSKTVWQLAFLWAGEPTVSWLGQKVTHEYGIQHFTNSQQAVVLEWKRNSRERTLVNYQDFLNVLFFSFFLFFLPLFSLCFFFFFLFFLLVSFCDESELLGLIICLFPPSWQVKTLTSFELIDTCTLQCMPISRRRKQEWRTRIDFDAL